MDFQRKCAIVGLILAVVGGQFVPPVQAAEAMNFSALEDSGPQEIAKLVLREAYRRIGISIRFTTLPGERALIQANSGTTNGEVARIGGIEEDFENLVRVPVAISMLDGVVFTRNPANPSDGWDGLKGYRIGAFIGSKFVEKTPRDWMSLM